MGCNHFTIYFLIFFMSTSSQLIFSSEGRKLIKSADPFKSVNDEENTMLRGKIGSGPPKCVGRCRSCGQCEAIQVPTNPQINNSTTLSYVRGDYDSNYKPMSWKCKCGNTIFNP